MINQKYDSYYGVKSFLALNIGDCS